MPHKKGPELGDGESEAHPGWENKVRAYNGLLFQLAKTHSWTLVDFESYFLKMQPDVFVDACHFTAEGNQLAAELVFQALQARGWI